MPCISGHKTKPIINAFSLKTEITKVTKAATNAVSQRKVMSSFECIWLFLAASPQNAPVLWVCMLAVLRELVRPSGKDN